MRFFRQSTLLRGRSSTAQPLYPQRKSSRRSINSPWISISNTACYSQYQGRETGATAGKLCIYSTGRIFHKILPTTHSKGLFVSICRIFSFFSHLLLFLSLNLTAPVATSSKVFTIFSISFSPFSLGSNIFKMQYSSVILLVVFSATNVFAHGIIDSITGANGVTMPGLSGNGLV